MIVLRRFQAIPSPFLEAGFQYDDILFECIEKVRNFAIRPATFSVQQLSFQFGKR